MRLRLVIVCIIYFQSIGYSQPLSGSYTIGGTTPNYTNFTTAIADLQTNGISGPVTFNVRNGTYTEALFINAITGSSSINTVTFQSESGDSSLVIVTNGTSGNTFQLNTVRYITFRKMSVRHTGTSNASAISASFGSNIKVENCALQGGTNGNAFTGSHVDSTIYITNSRIITSNNGISINDQATPPYTPDVRVEGCNITGNNIAILFIELNSVTIRRNILSGGSYAIQFQGYVLGEDISYNTMKSTGGHPLQILGGSGPVGGLTHINNNLISVTNSTQPTDYGVQIINYDRFEFINNTVYFNSATYYHSAFYLHNADSCFIYNNIFRNNGAGYVYEIGTVSNYHSDNNVFSLNTGTFSYLYPAFSQYQLALNADSNSIVANPQFVSAPTNLHTTNPAIDNFAIPWPTVPDDIDGVLRHPQYPDPGAYEFSYAPSANLGPDQTICGNSTVLSAANNGSYYLWNTGDTSQSINATSTGTYWVQINNLAGTSSDTINVTIHPLPGITISGNNSICVNDSTQLSVTSPAITFSWSPISGLDNSNSSIVNASPSANTIYTITVTDNFGCSNSDSINITVNPLPIAQAGSDQSICSGGQTSLGTVSGMNCNWTPAAGLNLSTDCQPVASPLSTTNYILTVTDINGCQNNDSVLVTVNPLPSISICCPQAICMNDTATIAATSSGSNFSWSPTTGLSATTGAMVDAFPTSTTTYTVTATDAFACQSSDTVTITINPLPTASVCCDQTLCAGDTVSLTTTSSALNLSWSPSLGLNTTSGNNVNAFPGASTTYTVTATDANGCSFTDVVALTVNPAPAIPTITQNIGDLISSEPTGNQWYLNGTPISGATSQIYVPAQNGNYTVVYTDANGCSATSAIYYFGSTGIGVNYLTNPNIHFSNELSEIHFGKIPNGNFHLTIYNQLGQIIYSDDLIFTQSSLTHPVNLPEGNYFIVLSNIEHQFSSKIVVVHN